MINATLSWIRWRIAGRPTMDPFLEDLLPHLTQSIRNVTHATASIGMTFSATQAQIDKLRWALDQERKRH